MDPRANKLMAGLPERLYQQWLPHLEAIEMPDGLVLHEAGADPAHAYFPTTSMASLLHVAETGESVEVAVIGNEGVVGISRIMGVHASTSRAVVSGAGRGFRLGAAHLQEVAQQGGPAMQLLLRYTQALVTQMAQTAACNRHHLLEQRLCRWLLFRLDRSSTHHIVMAPKLIGMTLGVRPEGLTEAALALQTDGVITLDQNHITVLDRSALERRSCECYAVVKKEYDRLLPAHPSRQSPAP